MKFLYVLLAMGMTNLSYAQPVIQSFSPASGPVGTTVTISGTNFSSTPADNNIYFGAVKASVITASPTSLTVKVPAGATFEPITITTGGLTAYAAQPFNTTFPSSGAISEASFNKTDWQTGEVPERVAMMDFDADGKSDLIVLNTWGNSFSIFRNISTPGNAAFATRTDYAIDGGSLSMGIKDIDGDGKADVVLCRGSVAKSFSIFRNTTTGGNISFSKLNFSANVDARDVAISDFDGDGKNDLAFTQPNANVVSILRNTTAAGTISFAAKVDFATLNGPQSLCSGDVDGDQKPDLVVGGYTLSFAISILRNTSTAGNISFTAKQDFATPRYSTNIACADLDSDGRNEILVANSPGTSIVSVFPNLSTTGLFTLGTRMDVTTGTNPEHVYVSDIDGDGKPDLLTANSESSSVSILKNTSSGGALSFATKVDLTAGDYAWHIACGDLDGDLKPDIVVTNSGANTISLFATMSIPHITEFSPINGAGGTEITITGANLDLATAVTIGGKAVTSFTIVPSVGIKAIIAANSRGTIIVTTLTGTASIEGFGLTPAITSFSPLSGGIGTTVTINGSNFSSTASDNIVYFGSVRANVVTATATALTVTVPAGASYEPISVTANRLTAYTVKPFTVTFPGIGTAFAPNSFGAFAQHPTGSMPYEVCAGDLDGDGKNDVVVCNNGANTVSILRNTSATGLISFAEPIDYEAASPYSAALGDVDGDGKLDIIVGESSACIVYRNNSTPGAISFLPAVEIEFANGLYKIIAKDLDGDGKTDLAICDYSHIVIVKNTSNAETISFGAPVYFTIGYMPGSLAVNDLDGDGKPDIAIIYTGNGVDHSGHLALYKNTMVAGTSFSASSLTAAGTFATGNDPVSVRIADMEADGKPDVIVVAPGSGNLGIFKNTSTAGTISFATRSDVAIASSQLHFSMSDLDGDGKPDLAIPSWQQERVIVLKNISAAGAIAVADKQLYDMDGQPQSAAISDLDGDGKPDLLTANYSEDGLSVFRNQIAEATVVPSGTNPVSGRIVNKAIVANTVPLHHGTPYVQRHYEVVPDDNAATATATVTLYFTQEEFTNFNALAGHGADLPTGASDGVGKANVRIYQYRGVSTTGLPGSYSGEATLIDPADADIVWHPETAWWTVTFNVTGFSGFFLSNAAFNYLQPATPDAPVITANAVTTFCQGGSVTLNSSVATNNQWYKNGTAIGGATGASLVVNASGSYYATTTVSGVSSANSNAISVTVNTVPIKPTISQNGSKLVSSAASGNQWYKDGAPIAGATGSEILPISAGSYSVVVTLNGCSGSRSDVFVYAVTGVIQIDNTQFIRLSPNPVVDRVLLDFNVSGAPVLTVQIIDLHGRVCKTFVNQARGSRLSLAGLGTGVYTARIFVGRTVRSYSMQLLKR